MATKTKATPKATAPKESKVNPADEINAQMVDELLECFSLERELEVYLELDKLNQSGALSVRGIKRTIEKVEESGDLPSLKSAYAQDFPLVRKMRAELKGGESASLKKLFNLAFHSRIAFGGTENASQKVAASLEVDTLAHKVKEAKAAKTRGAAKKTAAEKKAAQPKKVSAKEMAQLLTLALEGKEPIPAITLENLQRAISKRLKAMKA